MNEITPSQLAILIGFLLLIAVALVVAVKAPPPKNIMKWRSMTVSSILDHPGVRLLFIVGIAVLFTMLFRGKVTTRGAP